MVTDVDDVKGAETVRLIEADGGIAKYRHCDVTVADEVKGAVDAAVSEFGGLHCAHNNAGHVGQPGWLHEYDIDMFKYVLDINAVGTFLSLKYELSHMVANGGGTVVNTASGSGLGASPMMPGYVAGKHAVVGLTKVAGVDYAKKGVRVNAICPGATMTPMMEEWLHDDPKMLALMEGSHPIGRLATPEEIAEAAVWLCSDAASYVTGAALCVDGGAVALVGGGATE